MLIDDHGIWIDAIINENWNFLDSDGKILNYSNAGTSFIYSEKRKIMLEGVSFMARDRI